MNGPGSISSIQLNLTIMHFAFTRKKIKKRKKKENKHRMNFLIGNQRQYFLPRCTHINKFYLKIYSTVCVLLFLNSFFSVVVVFSFLRLVEEETAPI